MRPQQWGHHSIISLFVRRKGDWNAFSFFTIAKRQQSTSQVGSLHRSQIGEHFELSASRRGRNQCGLNHPVYDSVQIDRGKTAKKNSFLTMQVRALKWCPYSPSSSHPFWKKKAGGGISITPKTSWSVSHLLLIGWPCPSVSVREDFALYKENRQMHIYLANTIVQHYE